MRCKASVIERDGQFQKGLQEHTCAANPGRETVAKLRRDIKLKAVDNPFRSATEIVEEAILGDIGPGNIAQHPTLPRPTNLAQQANRKRKAARPNHPADLDFVLALEHLPPNFFQKDVIIADQRHIVFATEQMLNLLCRARKWYVDATFKLVKAPFMQLFSVHCFIKSGESIKQVPLVFVLMSGRSTTDYVGVFEAILDVLPTVPAVTKLVADYEASIWQAMRRVFPDATFMGCLFHFTQRIYKKVQEIGLQRAYAQDAGTHQLVKQLMALPLLPVEHIEPIFNYLQRNAGNSAHIRELLFYMRTTWVNGNTFTAADWSVFGQETRTNNDLEGYHNRLNRKGRRAKLQFYLMVKLLHSEAQMVNVTTELVLREDVTRTQRSTSVMCTRRLQSLWEQYRNGERTARSLLVAGARIVANNQLRE